MSLPLVSIVTPAYNAGPYLRECIESVLAQTYDAWNYTIINNCSTDDTLAIAEEYAKRDSRIRVVTNDRHLRIIPNHNAAVRAISPDSAYCKVLSADDWLFPQCLASMVNLGEAYPSVTVIGAYGLCGTKVAWDGLPFPSTVVAGHEICRAILMGELRVFGSPTTTMFRSAAVRSRDPFYNESNLHADSEVCFELLKDGDFGFVHEVLTFTRVDNPSMRATARRLNVFLVGYISDVLKFGKIFLDRAEYDRRLTELWREYYTFLAYAIPKADREFWRFHKQKLDAFGHPLNRVKLLKAVLARGFDAVLNPKRTLSGWV